MDVLYDGIESALTFSRRSRPRNSSTNEFENNEGALSWRCKDLINSNAERHRNWRRWRKRSGLLATSLNQQRPQNIATIPRRDFRPFFRGRIVIRLRVSLPPRASIVRRDPDLSWHLHPLAWHSPSTGSTTRQYLRDPTRTLAATVMTKTRRKQFDKTLLAIDPLTRKWLDFPALNRLRCLASI